MKFKIKMDWNYSYVNDKEYLQVEADELEENIKRDEDSIKISQQFLIGDKIRLGALYKRLLELNQSNDKAV